MACEHYFVLVGSPANPTWVRAKLLHRLVWSRPRHKHGVLSLCACLLPTLVRHQCLLWLKCISYTTGISFLPVSPFSTRFLVSSHFMESGTFSLSISLSPAFILSYKGKIYPLSHSIKPLPSDSEKVSPHWGFSLTSIFLPIPFVSWCFGHIEPRIESLFHWCYHTATHTASGLKPSSTDISYFAQPSRAVVLLSLWRLQNTKQASRAAFHVFLQEFP